MLAIKRAFIHPVTAAPFKGTIFVQDGRIAAVGSDVEIPTGAEVVDGEGFHLAPGFVEAHSHLVAHDRSSSESDAVPKRPLGPTATTDLDYYWLFDPQHIHLSDARKGGVTTALIRPGSGRPIDGIGFVTKTAGTSRRDMLMKRPDGVKMALGENPKRAFGQRRGEFPSTRMGTASVIREALVKAENYQQKRARKPEDTPEEPGLNLLVRLLEGELSARVHAHRADDIVTAIRLADEFGFNLTIEHATDGHKIAGTISEHNVPCVVGPSFTARGKMEVKDRTFATANILNDAGVKVAITTDAGVVFIEYLRICAALAVRAGMSRTAALKAITLNAAEICGVAHRVGSLEVGKDADFVLLNGPPLDLTSRVEFTYLQGRKVYDVNTFEEEWEKYQNPFLEKDN